MVEIVPVTEVIGFLEKKGNIPTADSCARIKTCTCS